MASIHKRGTSRFWWVSLRMPSRRIVFRSSRMADREQALRLCAGLSEFMKHRPTEEEAALVVDYVFNQK